MVYSMLGEKKRQVGTESSRKPEGGLIRPNYFPWTWKPE